MNDYVHYPIKIRLLLLSRFFFLTIIQTKHFKLFCLKPSMQIGAEIFKKALSYPARQIAKNAGVNGSVVVEKVISQRCIILLRVY